MKSPTNYFPLWAGLIFTGVLTLSTAARADEGMWTFDNFPSDKVKQAYGFAPDATWLKHVQLSSLRLAQGCSASFVSGQGLVMTNHHCARDCTDGLSDAKHDYVRDGFLAPTLMEERKCPALEINQLVAITDVTGAVHAATAGKAGKAFSDAERAAEAAARDTCGKGDDIRCDVVKLYGGAQFKLYHYRRYQDVRLVWSPEDGAANFGGDPDNFEFPRFALDAAMVRVYDGGKPLVTTDHLNFARTAPKAGDVVFVSGNPGDTQRLATAAELVFLRDHILPRRLIDLDYLIGAFDQFAATSQESKRIALDDIFFSRNSFKALTGEHQALTTGALLSGKVRAEGLLRARVAKDPKLADVAGAWDAIEKAVAHEADIFAVHSALEAYPRRMSALLRDAVSIVRHAAESGKPNGERLRGYTDAEFPALRQGVLSPAPIYPSLERVKLTTLFLKMRELLTVSDPNYAAVFAKDSPEALAEHIAAESKLYDPVVRKALLEGGAAAVAASDDPAIVFVRDRLDPPARRVREDMETNVDAVITQGQTQIAQALFAVYGTGVSPDATFSPRLTYGSVSGYPERGRTVEPLTTWGGAFDHETGASPFVAPKSWGAAKARLDLSRPLDIASTNDIIGGNSGSPMVNRNGEAVGLIFDGNIQSLGGDFAFDMTDNRAVSVSTDAILQALDKVYHADRLVKELAP